MSGVNAVEKQRWNDPTWVKAWPQREALTDAITPFLLEVLAPVAGERVLDVGCGAGRATIAAAQLVGPSGRVVGADLSAGLNQLAAERAADAGVENVTFTVADMQEAMLDDAPFDAVMSQFGVMFFDEPVTAFANIHAHLTPGGRIAFSCWQTIDKNRWHVGSALVGYAPPLPAPEPGKSEAGPFAFADAARTKGILEAAGFTHVRSTAHELETDVPVDALVDSAQLARAGVPTDKLAAAQAALDAHVDQFRTGPDSVKLPLAFLTFHATSN